MKNWSGATSWAINTSNSDGKAASRQGSGFCFYGRGFMNNTRRVDFFTGIGFMAVGVYVFISANGFLQVERGIGPGDYPKVIAAGLFILGAILSASSFLRGFPKQKEKINWKPALRLAVFTAVTLAYIQLMKILGFIVLTPFYLFFGMYFFGYHRRTHDQKAVPKYRRWLTMILVSILVTAAVHIIFRELFLVMLPVFRLF